MSARGRRSWWPRVRVRLRTWLFAGIPVTVGLIALALVAYGKSGSDDASAGGASSDSTWAARAVHVAERATRRMYDGAPPVVPHSIADMSRDDCLMCHLEGGYVDPETQRTAPVTPHPERINCRQCHVPQVVTTEFRPNDFQRLPRPTPPARLQPLGPPYIPHRLQDRDHCLACHLSPSAPQVMRPAHGERTNCIQCHVQLAVAAPPFEPAHRVGEERRGP